MEVIEINNKRYQVMKNYKDAINIEEIAERLTDYFDDFDYIVGDWAYGKLRLKGFYDSDNKKCKKINDISGLDNYIENSCAYGCKWFQIKRKKELKS